MYSLSDMKITHSDGHINFPRDELEALKRDVISFAGMLKEMEANCFPVAGEDDDAIAAVSSSTDAPKMVGLSDQYEQLKGQLKDRDNRFGPEGLIVPWVVVLVGMPGIGKTTLATKIFQDPHTVANFDCRVWVTVGRKCRLKEIPRRILAALNPDAGSDQNLDDKGIARCLRKCLKRKRYLIVLDDVWNQYMVCQFRSDSEWNSFEPGDTFHWDGKVVITTRIHQVEMHYEQDVLKMRLLNKDESWDLLREKVFGEERSCPSHLEEDGKKIAQNCDGLPLTILTVAHLLCKEEKTPKYWRDVAAKKNHKLFIDAYDKISKVLYSSYQELTPVLKSSFLYIGVFPQNFEIRRSKLLSLWSVDGFIETGECKFQYPSAIECLDELVSNSVVMIYQSTIGYDWEVGSHQIKACGLHSSLWYMSRREAEKTKFCHVLNILDDCSDDYLEGESRLSFHNNILFGIKGVCQSVEDKCTSTVHSLLCYGSYQPYQVPICFGLNKIQELDALTIRFYEFPMEVLQLVELKYLALTMNGKLPSSVSQLSKLQFLIVDRHMSIRSYTELSTYLPMEIWDLKELKHLRVTGSDLLPDPRGSLETLSKLSNVSAHSCIEGVLKAIPNLRKLGVRIESVPNDGGESLVCFDHIYHLEKLASLKCVVVNPESVPRFALSPSFPKNLRKLTLSGLGCSWGEISKIASLEFLEVLKLRNYACRGPKWELKGGYFIRLKSLVIEDTDLEEWTIGNESLVRLQSLRLKHCYKLQRIHWESYHPPILLFHFACEHSLQKIELVDCNPWGVEQMKKALEPSKQDALTVHSSWKDEKLKT
ncbi:hypothetical protein C2S53_011368 [Perilla frutescens var. hirtella]|uniref:NB-ARC domain-containing protein n=1 Tax=Perilla frutescens var. hirtella TaxID=608512 RepID=A0AAD4J9X8_PERFH|nr:hypothetical protein C2S53_011368 [Perilla frutescens var. hirtella]